jgi:hypothetical protein
MKPFHLLFFALLLTAVASGHPSYGIVITENNEIIFCDVLHNGGTLWKLDEEGKLNEILTGEHSHFIFMDQEGQVWGTNHEYVEARDTNLNSLWKWVNGRKQLVIPPTDDPRVFSGVNFVVGTDGKIYYNAHRQLYVRDTNGDTQLLSPHEFGRIMSLQLAPDGQIIVVDNYAENGSLIKVSLLGDLTYVGTDLIEANPPNPPFKEARFNLLYASFADKAGNTFVANSGSRRISRVDVSGQIAHIFYSEAPWYPVAYTEKDGIGYVMEMSYIPGIGNLGPQIQRLENGEATILVNVDAEKMPKPSEPLEDDPDEDGAAAPPAPWFWYGLASALLLIFIGRHLGKRWSKKALLG